MFTKDTNWYDRHIAQSLTTNFSSPNYFSPTFLAKCYVSLVHLKERNESIRTQMVLQCICSFIAVSLPSQRSKEVLVTITSAILWKNFLFKNLTNYSKHQKNISSAHLVKKLLFELTFRKIHLHNKIFLEKVQ